MNKCCSVDNNNQTTTNNLTIWTPFFRTIVNVESIPGGCVEEPDFNYIEYTLFVLKTRLAPWISKKWDKKIFIIWYD